MIPRIANRRRTASDYHVLPGAVACAALLAAVCGCNASDFPVLEDETPGGVSRGSSSQPGVDAGGAASTADNQPAGGGLQAPALAGIVVLQDFSAWHVFENDYGVAAAWGVGDPVTPRVTSYGSPVYADLRNARTSETVSAAYMGQGIPLTVRELVAGRDGATWATFSNGTRGPISFVPARVEALRANERVVAIPYTHDYGGEILVQLDSGQAMSLLGRVPLSGYLPSNEPDGECADGGRGSVGHWEDFGADYFDCGARVP